MLSLFNTSTVDLVLNAVVLGGILGLLYQMRRLVSHVRKCDTQMEDMTRLMHTHLTHAKMHAASLQMQKDFLATQASAEKSPEYF